jgi:exopolyphosphatase/guanosine-5'-triphosphate,3'-diphosphate pyrophosphatase
VSKKRVASIDIGTNSVLLLIAEVGSDGELDPIHEEATITRLGQGVDKTRCLAPEAVERTLACIRAYADAIAAAGAGAVAAVGTSAMRDAEGGEAFAASAEKLLGVRPRVISGDEEARLTFLGGLSGLSAALRSENVGVFDIGGGSTEFILGAGEAIDSGISLNVGSVRLTERHLRADPPTADEWAACRADIERELARAPSLEGRPLVGIAGTVTTIAAIARDIDPYVGAKVHGVVLDRAEVERVTAQLVQAPLAERKRMRGLSPNRADVIAAGAELCAAVMRHARADQLVVSDRGVRWGLAETLK